MIQPILRRILPTPVKTVIRGFRQAIAVPPIDATVLFDYPVEAEVSNVPRLTMVFQYLTKDMDFGGAATAIDLFGRLVIMLGKIEPVDVRFIVTDANARTDPGIIIKWAAKAGLAITPDQIELVSSSRHTIKVRAREVFLPIIWWNTINFAKVRSQQVKLFGGPALPIIYLIQDYEPAFYEFSSAHMLARDAFAIPQPLWGIINSGSLAKYLEFMGQLPQRSFVFEPVVVEALRPYLAQVASSERRKRILVYGRQAIARNCFPALVRSLQRWARDYPEFADWEVVSAGAAHRPVDLGAGRAMVSLGKLSLDEYAGTLLGSSVGVSLMASPHPSYPPLEMAHFGVRTVTNSYPCKDLSGYHSNIISVPSVSDAALATAIAQACRLSEGPCDASVNRDYVRTEPYPFLEELAAQLSGVLSGSGPSPAATLNAI
jgi:hypothetical protein